MLPTAILFSLLMVVIRDHCGHSCGSIALAGVVASTLPAVAGVAKTFDKAVSSEAKLYGIPLSFLDKVIAESLAKKIAPIVKHRDIPANTSSSSSPTLQKRMDMDDYDFDDTWRYNGVLNLGIDIDLDDPDDPDAKYWQPTLSCTMENYHIFVKAKCRQDDPRKFDYWCVGSGGEKKFDETCPENTECEEVQWENPPPGSLNHARGWPHMLDAIECVKEDVDGEVSAQDVHGGQTQVQFALLDQYENASVTAVLFDLYGSKVDLVDKFTCSYAEKTMCKQHDDNVFDHDSCLPTRLQALKRLQEVTCQLELRSVVDVILFLIIKGTKTAKK